MATQLDFYGILQVHPRAEKEVIDAAYRRPAAKCHPDVSQVSDASERMKQINTAYEVPKLVVSLVVISLVVWLLFSLVKPRG